MKYRFFFSITCLALALALFICGCPSDEGSPAYSGSEKEKKGTTDTDTDTDSDTDTDTDSDSDSDMDTDSDSDDEEEGPMEPDCTECASSLTGNSLEAMLCAVDLCGECVLDTQFASPTNARTNGAYAAVARFGAQTNELEPLYNGSYALMATGTATGTNHSVDMGGSSQNDEFANDSSRPTNDVMEWSIRLKAPEGAHGFQIHYVFFSEEYDEYVGSRYNDKFYIFLEAPSTNGGERTVINFTKCRGGYAGDVICNQTLEDMGLCTQGDKLCYIAINTALSECCWYGGCTTSNQNTDITGTGYSCGTKLQDGLIGGDKYGSSTGWLKTEWPIEPEEEFNVIFHIHDTSDHILDSEVIIDKFWFVGKPDPGTTPLE